MVRDGLRIKDIEVIPIQVELPRVFKGSHYQMGKRCTLITRVFTDCGIVGEAYNGDTEDGQDEIVNVIRNELVPALLGRDVVNVEGCWEAMLPSSFNILRDRSLAMQAIACVDSAIWDAIGKMLGIPLYKLWGGYRDALPAIAIGGYYGSSNKDIAREIKWYRELGFAGCKFKVGGLSPHEDAARLRIAREAGGPDFVLMADANQGYTRAEAIELIRLMEDIGLRWFEEPCRWYNDRLAMRDVRMIGGVSIAAGQSETSRAAIRDLMVDGAVDVCNADASWIGGPTEWRRIAALAAAFEVAMGHHEEPHLAIHLLASIPHGTYVECFDPERDPIFWQMVANRPELRDGLYPAPQGPGLGLELDQDFIAKYRV